MRVTPSHHPFLDVIFPYPPSHWEPHDYGKPSPMAPLPAGGFGDMFGSLLERPCFCSYSWDGCDRIIMDKSWINPWINPWIFTGLRTVSFW